MAKPKLCLGTAQFGQLYGITNQKPAIEEEIAREILIVANSEKIYDLDTAIGYGRSQEIIGKAKAGLAVNITSKIKIGVNKSEEEDIEREWDQDLKEILTKLRIKTLNTLLIHDTENVKEKNGELFCRWAKKQKDNGIIERTGISIYEGKDIDHLPKELKEVVQLPLSIYDQRAIQDGTIDKLIKDECNIQLEAYSCRDYYYRMERIGRNGWARESERITNDTYKKSKE